MRLKTAETVCEKPSPESLQSLLAFSQKRYASRDVRKAAPED